MASQRRTGSLPGISLPVMRSPIGCVAGRKTAGKVLALLLGICVGWSQAMDRSPARPARHASAPKGSTISSGDICRSASRVISFSATDHGLEPEATRRGAFPQEVIAAVVRIVPDGEYAAQVHGAADRDRAPWEAGGAHGHPACSTRPRCASCSGVRRGYSRRPDLNQGCLQTGQPRADACHLLSHVQHPAQAHGASEPHDRRSIFVCYNR